ncbi:MAG: hypothetical protein ACLQBQ_02190, partial [Smithella sp.]
RNISNENYINIALRLLLSEIPLRLMNQKAIRSIFHKVNSIRSADFFRQGRSADIAAHTSARVISLPVHCPDNIRL